MRFHGGAKEAGRFDGEWEAGVFNFGDAAIALPSPFLKGEPEIEEVCFFILHGVGVASGGAFQFVRAGAEADGFADFAAVGPVSERGWPLFEPFELGSDFPFGAAGVESIRDAREGSVGEDVFFDGVVRGVVFEILRFVSDRGDGGETDGGEPCVHDGEEIVGGLFFSADIGHEDGIGPDAALVEADKDAGGIDTGAVADDEGLAGGDLELELWVGHSFPSVLMKWSMRAAATRASSGRSSASL